MKFILERLILQAHSEKQGAFLFSWLNTGYGKAEKYTWGISENTFYLFKKVETLKATNSHIDGRDFKEMFPPR